MTADGKLWPIVTVPIENEADVVTVRQRAHRLAELLGFERQDQTRIATAVSELARNAFSYAGGGRAEFILDPTPMPQVFHVRISDKGPGIADVQTILDGQYRSKSGMGLGILGARRLMDHFKIESKPGKGTIVEVGHVLPDRAAAITRAKLGDASATLKRDSSSDPLEVLRQQNRELLQSLDEIRRKEEESKQLDQELSDTNRGVVALYAELDERAEQLRHASELKTKFLSNMSHEFRTPLNSVLALSRLLLDRIDGDLTPEQERQVGYIRRSAESLLELVNDLLDLAKVEAGKVDVKPSAFTVGELFGGLRGALKPLLTGHAVELIFDIPDKVPNLFTDEAKVTQILRNLISNALKFTEQGEVRVTASFDAAARRVNLSVRDTGIGIAPQDHRRIFEEFSQVDTKIQKRVKGTGLGLPLSRSLAELLGGELILESVLGQGSVFTLSIPPERGDPLRAQRAADNARKRVLLIDDDETFRYVMRQIISNEPRYEFLEAIDGDDGLKVAREQQPDVIILDLQMPTVDGFTVLQELGADSRTSVTPVIVSTSLNVNAELKARLPAGTRVISKNTISRENVSLFLRDATQGAS
ncbi:response regulator [Bradyrhizobium tropiciagri]|uniref:ATP-binding protein n=1 Tax=Bradyrhizobium tropiciagri TaxID=312253 RepID=UPI001BAE190D|nr:ATP-binding protein [Bradyrhizobium tropiciagri]MBR0869015.1 response regulator [Bradyrhizobium tropiciagri]